MLVKGTQWLHCNPVETESARRVLEMLNVEQDGHKSARLRDDRKKTDGNLQTHSSTAVDRFRALAGFQTWLPGERRVCLTTEYNTY